jgi:RNA polymerase sigma-70 factor, ECF subfamily
VSRYEHAPATGATASDGVRNVNLGSIQPDKKDFGANEIFADRLSLPIRTVLLGKTQRGMMSHSENVQLLWQAFDELFGALYGYAMVLSRDRAQAEDLVQETCLRAIQAVDSFRPGNTVKSWLFTILRNIWLNQLRQRRTDPVLVNIDTEDGFTEIVFESRRDPHALYVSTVECRQVREAIQLLPEEHREIIVLREYEEMSYQEIAKLLECPLGTVMSRLGRARAKLRALLLAPEQPAKDGQE